MTESFADIEERCSTLEDFAAAATDGDLLAAYDLLSNLYDATDGDTIAAGGKPRRLLRGWILVHTTRHPKDEPLSVAWKQEAVGRYQYLRRENDEDRRRADSYARYMADAEDAWSHAVHAIAVRLAEAKLPWTASVWQTGGGCLAIGVAENDERIGASDDAGTGRYLMLTDSEGPIGPTRDYSEYAEPELARWGLGLYESEGEPLAYLTLDQRCDKPAQDPQMAEAVVGIIKFATTTH